jgi:hypothetical protein
MLFRDVSDEGRESAYQFPCQEEEIQSDFVFFRSLRRLLVTVNVVPSSPIPVTLIMEALSSSESLVLTTATQRKIPEDGILLSHRRENLKSYIGPKYSAWFFK